MKPTSRGRALLRQMLSERNRFPEREPHIDEQIHRTFGRTVAILVLDMVGFSRLTLERGIVHYMAMIHQMDRIARPAVSANGGRVIKQEADNLFCAFPDPAGALEGALDVLRAFDAVNSVLPPERHVYGSVGIGYGPTLLIGDRDMFGAEMNLACKLGEDLAGTNEILLTRAAHDALPDGTYKCAPTSFAIAGVELEAYRFVEKFVHQA